MLLFYLNYEAKKYLLHPGRFSTKPFDPEKYLQDVEQEGQIFQSLRVGDSFSDIEFRYGKFEEDQGNNSSVEAISYKRGNLNVAVDKKTNKVSYFGYTCHGASDKTQFNSIACSEHIDSLKNRFNNHYAIYCDKKDERVGVFSLKDASVLNSFKQDLVADFAVADSEAISNFLKSRHTSCPYSEKAEIMTDAQ